MKLTTILLAVILSVNFMHLHAKDATPDSIQTPPTYEELDARLKKENKNDKKVEIYKQMLEIKANENKALTDSLKSTRESFEDFKGTASFRYLTYDVSIFAEDLPEMTEIHPALHSFARAISTIKSFNNQIDEMEKTLVDAKDEVARKGDITYKDYLKSDIAIQNEREKLEEYAEKVNSMDLSMFSPEQEKYIEDLFAKYETINKKFE